MAGWVGAVCERLLMRRLCSHPFKALVAILVAFQSIHSWPLSSAGAGLGKGTRACDSFPHAVLRSKDSRRLLAQLWSCHFGIFVGAHSETM